MEEELLMSTPTTITTTKRKVIECVFEENNDSSDTIVHMEKKRRIAPPRIESMGLLPLPPVNGLFHISPFEQEELGGVPTFDIFLNCFFHLGWYVGCRRRLFFTPYVSNNRHQGYFGKVEASL